MWISDVVLTDSGKSILGKDAPAGISFDPAGVPVRLTLKGRLNADHPPSLSSSEYSYPGFPFQGLIHQTFADNLPLRRVLLDDSIFLPLDAQSQVSDDQLTIVLNTKALTDLAISTLHTISVVDRENSASAEIKVTNSSRMPSLQPLITKVEVVSGVKFKARPGKPFGIDGPPFGGKPSADETATGVPAASDAPAHGRVQGSPHSSQFTLLHDSEDGGDDGKYLRVEGYNFPVSIYMHWAQLNGARIYAHATWITDEEQPKSILFLHLSDDILLKPAGQNVISYANPFGFRFFWF